MRKQNNKVTIDKITKKNKDTTAKIKKEYFVYIIECSNKSLYTGITTDINRRFNEHKNKKTGAKYTKAFKPEKIVAVFTTGKVVNARSVATKLEYSIKCLAREYKLLLVNGDIDLKDICQDKKTFSKIKRVY